jgi:hypothetical protein
MQVTAWPILHIFNVTWQLRVQQGICRIHYLGINSEMNERRDPEKKMTLKQESFV